MVKRAQEEVNKRKKTTTVTKYNNYF